MHVESKLWAVTNKKQGKEGGMGKGIDFPWSKGTTKKQKCMEFFCINSSTWYLVIKKALRLDK